MHPYRDIHIVSENNVMWRLGLFVVLPGSAYGFHQAFPTRLDNVGVFKHGAFRNVILGFSQGLVSRTGSGRACSVLLCQSKARKLVNLVGLYRQNGLCVAVLPQPV
jgi:hypothetical protein